MDEDKERKLITTLDHLHSNIITWKEFQDWFQLQGEIRDQVHNAQMFETGQTRIQEGNTFQLSNKRVEPKIEIMLPIFSKKSDANLVFIVFENRKAIFFNQEDMSNVH